MLLLTLGKAGTQTFIHLKEYVVRPGATEERAYDEQQYLLALVILIFFFIKLLLLFFVNVIRSIDSS